MRLVTKHFAFSLGRDHWDYRGPKWWKLRISIAVVHRAVPEWEIEPPYRYSFGAYFWLLPNFIWWQTVIRQQVGVVEYQNRIIGIQGWPFYAWFQRY